MLAYAFRLLGITLSRVMGNISREASSSSLSSAERVVFKNKVRRVPVMPLKSLYSSQGTVKLFSYLKILTIYMTDLSGLLRHQNKIKFIGPTHIGIKKATKSLLPVLFRSNLLTMISLTVWQLLPLICPMCKKQSAIILFMKRENCYFYLVPDYTSHTQIRILP